MCLNNVKLSCGHSGDIETKVIIIKWWEYYNERNSTNLHTKWMLPLIMLVPPIICGFEQNGVKQFVL